MADETHVRDILNTVETLSGHALNEDEGVIIGRAEQRVGAAIVCWMATRDALTEAEASSADLVIAHESLFYPYNARPKADAPEPWERWQTNRQRREIIERAGFTLARVHGSADEICIFDTAASILGLGEPVLGTGCEKVNEIEPVALRDLIERVKRAVGLDHVRVSCSDTDLDRRMHRVGMPWGGLGLFVNVSYQQWALEQGCDVLIAGESDSYGFRFSGECDVPMIETSHELSEIPGLRKFTELLAERHPDVSFAFHDNGNAWQWV